MSSKIVCDFKLNPKGVWKIGWTGYEVIWPEGKPNEEERDLVSLIFKAMKDFKEIERVSPFEARGTKYLRGDVEVLVSYGSSNKLYLERLYFFPIVV